MLAVLCVAAVAGLGAVIAAGRGGAPEAVTADAVAVAPRAEAQAATTPATSAPAAGPGTADVSVAAVGDIVMGTPKFGLPPAGGRRLFSAVKPLLRGDVVLGNLEQALATGPSAKCGSGSGGSCYAFASPPSYARNLSAAGFTVVTTANNHANDWGAAGMRSTDRALDRAGVKHAGSPGAIAVQRLDDGTKVAVIGMAPYRWSQDSRDVPRAVALVRKAATMAPIVIVSAHVGAEGAAHRRVPRGAEEYLDEPRGDTRRLARAVVDAGADLFVGHGPHVMRGMEFRNGRLIAYSLGNFLGYKVFNTAGYAGQSGVLQVTLGPDGRFRSGRLAPVRLSGTGVPSRGGTSVRDVATLSRQDFGRSSARLSANGTITPRS